jgi:alkanesulfonate monooxygenase SsuD/methylene tetrahydromethanopterin reductase-like flavin-dependent oxidoreductase (luciferase family)
MQVGLSPLQGQVSFEETLRECERAEVAGFDSIWLGEHHNNLILYPAPLIGLAAVASRTRRIHLGTGVLLLPLHHPMIVAAEGAMVDMISGGRVILGIGAGYAPEEFAALAVRSRSAGADWTRALLCSTGRRKRTSLIVESNYQVNGATVAPRPVQRPRPPIWFGAWVEPAIRRAVRLGDPWFVGPSANLDETALCAQAYQNACSETGKGEGEVGLFRYVFVASNAQQAISPAGESFIKALESMYFRWPYPTVKRPQGKLTIKRSPKTGLS